MLSRAKYGWSDVSDPVVALKRDSELVKDSESEDAAIRGIYGNQLTQLEHLINTQRVSQQQMRDQLVAVEKQYHRVSYLHGCPHFSVPLVDSIYASLSISE